MNSRQHTDTSTVRIMYKKIPAVILAVSLSLPGISSLIKPDAGNADYGRYGIGTTLAMLMFDDEKKSEFEIGYCDIEIDRTDGLRIHNKSNLPCFVRVAIDVSDSDKRLLCHFENLAREGWTSMRPSDESTYADEDGYYYCITSINGGEYTPKLYTSVSYDDSSVSESDIQIYAEAIICADYADYSKAWSSLDKQ